MEHIANKKIVGILGGMGPYATIMFQKNILDLTNANKDWDHIHTVTDSNTHIPSRSRAILYGETSPLEGMIESCKKLETYPVDVIYLPCNSACYWIDRVQMAIKIPIVDVVSAATEYMFGNYKVHKVTSLGGMVPYLTDLYKNSVEPFGAKYIRISEGLQKKVVDVIEAIKKSGSSKEFRESFLVILQEAINETSADAVILACTEFAEFNDIKIGVPVVDSSYALAKHVVAFAKGHKQIRLNTQKIKTFWDHRAKMLEDSKLGILQSTMLTSNESEAKEKWELEKSNLLNIVKPYLSKDGIMLELGCGVGRWSREFSPFVKSIDAFDYSNSFIKKAKMFAKEKNIYNVNFLCSDLADIREARQYNYIVSIALLHYLDEPRFNKVVEIIQNCLIKGGIAVLRESCGYGKRFELHGYYSEVLTDEYHAVYRTSEEIIESIGEKFSVIVNKISLLPTDKKPETCQKIILLRKISD